MIEVCCDRIQNSEDKGQGLKGKVFEMIFCNLFFEMCVAHG